MAVTEKGYVKSDAKVNAARAKLSAAKANLSKVQGVNLPGAKERAAEYQAQVDAAQREFDSAIADAKAYFAANKDKLQAAETAKTQAKAKKEQAASAEAIKSITSSGYLTPEQVAAINKAQFQAVKGPNSIISSQPNTGGNQITTKVEDFANTLKNARAELKSMSDSQRLTLANSLINAGYQVPKTGQFTDQLFMQYQAAIGAAQGAYKQYKEFPTVSAFLEDRARQQAAINAGGGGTGGKSYADTNIFSPSMAANYISSEIKQFLGRDATQKEITALTNKLVEAQKKNPSRVITDANGNRTTIQGLDPQGFLDAEIKKLPEYQKKELSKAQAVVSKILDTANANGILYDQSQQEAWAKRIQNGEDPAVIQNEIRLMASHGRPEAIAKQLAAGNDLSTIVSPYKQYMQQILEIPADQINLNDPTLQMAISGDKPMSLYDYQNALRKDPRWQYTDNAKTAVSDSVQKILQDFGFMG